MNDGLEIKIRQSLKEMEYHLRGLKKKKVDLREYRFPKIEINSITEAGDGRKLAQIDVEIMKEPILAVRTEIRDGKKETVGYTPLKELNDYWQWGIKLQMVRSEVPIANKALYLLQLRENVEKNFTDACDKEAVATIGQIITDMYDAFVKEKSDEKDIDYHQVTLHPSVFRTTVPQLSKATKITIVNFLKGLFLDPRNYAKILQHEKDGKFDLGKYFRTSITRQIVYE